MSLLCASHVGLRVPILPYAVSRVIVTVTRLLPGADVGAREICALGAVAAPPGDPS